MLSENSGMWSNISFSMLLAVTGKHNFIGQFKTFCDVPTKVWMFFVKKRNKSGISIKKTFLPVFPNKVKIHSWTVGPVNLKLLPDQKKFHWRVGGPALLGKTVLHVLINIVNKIFMHVLSLCQRDNLFIIFYGLIVNHVHFYLM